MSTTLIDSTDLWCSPRIVIVTTADYGTVSTADFHFNEWPTRTFADSFVQSLDWPNEVRYGWYNIYRPDAPVTLPRIEFFNAAPHRAQARACQMDRRRWKRRRFIPKLRAAGE